jgi:hypothetical protein
MNTDQTLHNLYNHGAHARTVEHYELKRVVNRDQGGARKRLISEENTPRKL